MNDQINLRDEVVSTQPCKECGKSYSITAGEKNFYETKKLTLPKRCRPCRAKIKAQKQTEKEKTN